MRSFPISHFYQLVEGGVQCGEGGLFVGATPMLVCSVRAGGRESWTVRPAEELDRELSESFGLPVDVAVKRDRLAGIARALNCGDLALAKIGALLLRFPDPPSLAKGAPARGSWELAERLYESGLLKEGWDESKHPRTGEPPNRGRFARNPAAPETDPSNSTAPRGGWSGLGETVRKTMIEARALMKAAGAKAVETGEVALWLDPELKVAIAALIEVLQAIEPSDLNSNEQQAIDQVRAATDPPKSLEELQQPPAQNALGYEQHHIVEQNPANLAKSPPEVVIEKFGPDVIDDPNNLVWVPRLKHERITALYNSKVAGDPQGRIYRQVVNAMDYQSQRAAGLAALRLIGVLQ